MNKLKSQIKIKRSPILTGLVLGFALVLMIPISDSVLGRPNFSFDTHGVACAAEYDEIMKLRAKKARGEALTQDEASRLGAAESNWNDICKGTYGSLPRVAPTTKIPDILSGGSAGVLDDMQPQNDQSPPLADNEGVVTDEQQQPLNNPKTRGSVLDSNISNVIE